MGNEESRNIRIGEDHAKAWEEGHKEGRADGIRLACAMVDEMYGRSNRHKFMQGDCVLAKLNMLPIEKLRPNPCPEATESADTTRDVSISREDLEYLLSRSYTAAGAFDRAEDISCSKVNGIADRCGYSLERRSPDDFWDTTYIAKPLEATEAAIAEEGK